MGWITLFYLGFIGTMLVGSMATLFKDGSLKQLGIGKPLAAGITSCLGTFQKHAVALTVSRRIEYIWRFTF